MLNIKKFWNGLKIVKKAVLESDSVGELEVDETSGKLNYHDNSSRSPVVTEDHAATLTNKSIDADQNTITNIDNNDIKAAAGIEESKLALDFPTATLDGDIQAHVTASSDVHGIGATASVVGTDTTQTLTNKTIDADNNTISNLEVDNLKSGVLDTDLSSVSALDDTIPSAKAAKAYTDGEVSTVSGNLSSHVSASTDVHGIGATASVVGTDTTQTLTNKTISAAVINGITLVSDYISEETQNNTQSGTAVTLTGITKPIVRLTNSGLVSITGISALEASNHGAVITIVNATANEIAVLNNVGTATERILTGVDDDIDLAPDACILLKYDAASDRYRIVGGAGGANPVIKAVAGENLSARDAAYISIGSADGGRTTGEAYKLQADDDNRIEFVGLVKETVTSGQTAKIITSGIVKGFSGLTVGKPVFLNPNTPGSFTQLDSDDPTFYNRWVVRLGIAITANLVLVSPDQAASAFFQSEVQADIEILNNQPTLQNLTNLVFDGATTDSFLIDYTLIRRTDSDSFAQTGRLRGVYNTDDAQWFMSDDFSGQNAGVSFSITNSGQIQYTSTNIAGTNYSGLLKYRIAISGGISETSFLIEDGDIITRESGNAVRLPVGQPGQVLSVSPDNILQYTERANPNYIINGNFDFWQRGTSLSAGVGIRFLADRWRNLSEGSTSAISRQTFTVGQNDVPNNPNFFQRTVVASSAGAGNRAFSSQFIENVALLSDKTVTISFWAKADAAKPISIEFLQNFGTGGSPSASVDSIGIQKYSLTTSWQKFTKTVTIPSISGKTIGTDGNSFLAVLFWLDAGSSYNSRTDSLGQQSGTFDIAQVKLEEGSVATPFVLAGGTIAGVLVACQRYYEKSYNINTSPGTNTGLAANIEDNSWPTTSTGFITKVQFRVTKRTVSPTITNYTSDGQVNRITLNGNPASTDTNVRDNIGDGGFKVFYGGSSNRISFHWTADAEL